MIVFRRLFFFLITWTQLASAQQSAFVPENKVYQGYIKTVQCYNTEKEQSLPVIILNSGEQLLFSFDDLEGGSKSYRYEVEHCTWDWKPSGISTLDYVSSFAGDRIQDYEYSSGTLQKYSHYKLLLPNDQVKFKISGNYLLKVYEDNHLKTPVASQRFFVTTNLVNISPEIITSPVVAERSSHQKINYSISTIGLSIQNPERDVKTVMMQNANAETAALNARPSFINTGSIQYKDLQTNLFKGGNEFRKLDLRAQQNNTVVLEDFSRNKQEYTSQFDENGNFFIKNLENRDADTENDYVPVEFNLVAANPDPAGELFVTGRFNQYRCDEASKLTYDLKKKKFQGNILLKQGLYDYKYVWRPQPVGSFDDTRFEGSYFETGNTYQIFIYYRKPGNRWDELVGYLSTQTDTLPALQ